MLWSFHHHEWDSNQNGQQTDFFVHGLMTNYHSPNYWIHLYIYGGFHKWGIPKMVGWYLKILLKIDNLGVPPFQEIPINIFYSFVILMSHERSGPCFFLIFHGSNTPSDRPPEGVLHFAWPGRDGLGADGTTCDFRAEWMRMGQIQHGHDEMLSGE